MASNPPTKEGTDQLQELLQEAADTDSLEDATCTRYKREKVGHSWRDQGICGEPATAAVIGLDGDELSVEFECAKHRSNEAVVDAAFGEGMAYE